jgi:hypothetical protein
VAVVLTTATITDCRYSTVTPQVSQVVACGTLCRSPPDCLCMTGGSVL